MELLGEFYEKNHDPTLSPAEEVCYKVRKAARAVIWNSAREVALIFVSKYNYHKLPGGGVERDEDLVAALRREVREELGGDIRVTGEVGATIEYRESTRLLQISYCFMVQLLGSVGATSLTDEEKARGFELEWAELNYAISALENDAPSDDVGHFIRQRDLTFLRQVRRMETDHLT
jgi:8-oxo-dGTP pyrophosphatase MutT (NUDIX family)